MTALGSNRDRHTNLGDGEIGVEGMIAFLSEPRFEGLPVIFEGPGRAGKDDRAASTWRGRTTCARAGWPRLSSLTAGSGSARRGDRLSGGRAGASSSSALKPASRAWTW